ncbi:MAG: sensor domain-containing diguanylate cyclase [Thermodesulfobacteriota bacterium]
MMTRVFNNPSLRWGVFWLILLLLGGFVTYNQLHMYNTIMDQERYHLMVQARAIGKNIERQLEATSLVLSKIQADVDLMRDFRSLQVTDTRLALLVDAMPGIRTLFFTDAEGTIQACNRPELVGRNFKQREYYLEPLRHPDPATLYVSPPFKSALGVYVLNVTRMIPGPDGGFRGVVTATLDPAYFETILQSVLYAPDMWNTLNHGDGLRFITVPFREGQAGKNLAVPGSMFTRHKESGRAESIFEGRAYATGENRLVALLTVQSPTLKMDKPLVIIVSRSPASILRRWRQEALVQALGFLMVAMCGFKLMLLLQHHADRERMAQQELQRFNEKLEHQATHDFLTDIYNRRKFTALMVAEMARASRYKTPLALVMLDIDHFKRINDSNGHAVGDQVLQEMCRIVSGRIRSLDIFGRWGGEEFALLLPGCDRDEAVRLAEILREMIARHPFGVVEQLTVSFGVASHICGEPEEAFVARADTGLYQAKQDGRNRVAVV